MNYHLMIDDKFIDAFISAAEKVSDHNRYIFTFQAPGKYVRSDLGVHAPFGSDQLDNIINGITAADRVFVHWFSDALMPFINKLNSNTPVYLFFWGGDFLEQPEEFYNFNFEPLTRKYWDRVNKYAMFHLSKNLFSYISQVKMYLSLNERLKREREDAIHNRQLFLSRLNFFCHWNEADLVRIKQFYNCDPVFKNFFYDLGFSKLPDEVSTNEPWKQPVIWLGNSASAPNNHLDAFSAMSGFKKESFKLYCPLSYGNKQYGKHISKKGKALFGDRFSDLKAFMPIDEYFNLIKHVDVVVMYHNRTQAAGNIFAFWRMGKKVFLKKESTIYTLALKLGIKIFDANLIADMRFTEFVRPLTLEEQENNRKRVNEAFSEENRYRYMKELLASDN